MTSSSAPPLWRQAGRLTLLSIGLMAVLVVLHILYMVVYSYLVNPGRPPEHYPAHAQASGPWFSTIVGMPLFFYAGRRLTRREGQRGLRHAMALCTIILIIELAFQVGSGAPFYWGSPWR